MKKPRTLFLTLGAVLAGVLLLLICFVVVQRFTLSEQGFMLRVPAASPSAEESAKVLDEVIVTVREEGEELIITIGRERCSLEELGKHMHRLVSLDKNRPVRILGDAHMSWQRMADVISTCSEAGVWNLSFSKQTPGGTPAAGAAPEPGNPAPAQP